MTSFCYDIILDVILQRHNVTRQHLTCVHDVVFFAFLIIMFHNFRVDSSLCNCGAAPHVDNGRMITQYQAVYSCNTMVEFRCDYGYRLYGNSQVTCDQYGRWGSTPYLYK